MHDYYPLIARALSRLESNTPAARHAVFRQVRIILLDQLLRRQPPASDSEIERECTALEDAIRKVESESAIPAVTPEAPAHASPNNRTRGSRPSRIFDQTSMANGSSRGSKMDSRHPTFKPTKTADSHSSHRRFTALKPHAQQLRTLIKWMRAILVDQLRRGQRLADSIPAIFRRANSTASGPISFSKGPASANDANWPGKCARSQ